MQASQKLAQVSQMTSYLGIGGGPVGLPTGAWQMATHLESGLRPATINLAWRTERKTEGQRIAMRSCHSALPKANLMRSSRDAVSAIKIGGKVRVE